MPGCRAERCLVCGVRGRAGLGWAGLGWAGLGWAVDMWAAGDIIVTRCVATLQPPAQSSSAAPAPQAGHPAVSVFNSVK